jgi:L-aminopeptidase/D-esterase-like protein
MTTPTEVFSEVNQATYNEIEKTFEILEKIEGFGSITEKAKTPTLEGIKTGATVGAGAGAILGAMVGGIVSAAMEHKKTAIAVTIAAVAYVYREEIGDFVSGIAGSENAGGDAFM